MKANIKSTATDRRIVKTKKTIHLALVALLTDKNISDVTITELCNQAEVNRKTFYMYYNTPLDVFKECIDLFADNLKATLDEFSKEMNILSPDLIFSLVTPLIESDVNIRYLITSPNTGLLYDHLINTFTEIFLSELEKDTATSKLTATSKNVIATLYAGSLITVYFRYANNPKVNLVEVTDLLSTILSDGIKSVF